MTNYFKDALGCLKYVDLEIGMTYRCQLADQNVLIIEIVTKEGQTMAGSYPLETQKLGIMYNRMTGSYNTFKPVDYQLYPIK